MELLRNTLPAGLTVWHISNEAVEYQQRSDYIINTPQFQPQVQHACEERPNIKPTRSVRIPNMLQQLAANIDDMYHSLTPAMKRETDNYLKQKVLEFVMSDAGNSALGPKRCREIVAYIGTPMVERSEPFFLLCSFLLDAKIVVDHKVYTWNHQTYANEVIVQCKV